MDSLDDVGQALTDALRAAAGGADLSRRQSSSAPAVLRSGRCAAAWRRRSDNGQAELALLQIQSMVLSSNLPPLAVTHNAAILIWSDGAGSGDESTRSEN